MDEKRKAKIFTSFPKEFDEAELDIILSAKEFDLFANGIYAGSMDEKWNIFVFDKILVFARSWTGYCIYKIQFQEIGDKVILKTLQVNRNSSQYAGNNIEDDLILFKKIIQIFLQRNDLHEEQALRIPIIKQVTEKEDPNNEYYKSVGSNTVGSIKTIYQTLTSPPNNAFYNVIGWLELENKISAKPDDEKLTTVFIQHKKNRSGKTFYFTEHGTEYLGTILISKRADFDFTKL